MANLGIELYKKLYLIRRAEEKIQEHYAEDEMKTPMHMSMGEEAIVAGVVEAAKKNSQMFGTYRSHALYLAKAMETEKFFAELYGKETGAAKGKGGSMHLALPDKGVMMTSAVVATTIPVAVGAALANAYENNGKIVVSFFGDGAVNEGVFWESLNFAALKKLPILFVCQDNDFAIHSRAKDRISHRPVGEIAESFGFVTDESSSTDVEEIYNKTEQILVKMKESGMPGFLYTKYYRYLEHVGVKEDFDAGYRSKEEAAEWFIADPVAFQRAKLLQLGVDEKEIAEIEKSIGEDIEKSITKAKEAAFPKSDELLKDVFA
jgi:acetoin:2,6-dichlorophenolindophenol oxidoreductase subunit alpha